MSENLEILVRNALAKGVRMAITDCLANFGTAPSRVASDDSVEFSIACEFLDLEEKAPLSPEKLRGRVMELLLLYDPKSGKDDDEIEMRKKLSQRVAWSVEIITRHYGW